MLCENGFLMRKIPPESQNDFPSGESLSGKLLLAMPGMGDPRFHKAVILICAHDKNGAMGLVVNHALPGLVFSELLKQLGISSEINIEFSSKDMTVMCGGPVDNSRGFLLHSNDFKQTDTVKVDENLSVTGTIEALQRVAHGQGPQKALFILGYAGWGSGQLEQEIANNAWLVLDCDLSVVFHYKADEKWSMALKNFGLDPAMLTTYSGTA